MIEHTVVSRLISALSRHMYITSPTLTIYGESVRPSRKIFGQFTNESEVQAYRAICCYMQKGLGTHIDVVRRLANAITSFQCGQSRGFYFFHLFSFGWEDNVLHHYPRAAHLDGIHEKGLAMSLCQLAGTSTVNSVPVVPSLFPSAVDIYNVDANVGREDLFVFLCTDRSVKLSVAAKRAYSREIQRNSVWIFLADDSLDFEISKFVPECL